MRKESDFTKFEERSLESIDTIQREFFKHRPSEAHFEKSNKSGTNPPLKNDPPQMEETTRENPGK